MIQVIVQYLAFRSTDTFVFPVKPGMESLKNEVLLEYIFRQCNHVDGSEWIAGKKFRSLSVGDVVIIMDIPDEYKQGRFFEPPEGIKVNTYQCVGIGWKKL